MVGLAPFTVIDTKSAIGNDVHTGNGQIHKEKEAEVVNWVH